MPVVGLVQAVAALRPALRNARRRKKAEPELLRAIESATGQRVELRLKFNACRTHDFRAGAVSGCGWLSRATLARVRTDGIGDTGSAHLFLADRRMASLRRLDKRCTKHACETPAPGDPRR